MDRLGPKHVELTYVINKTQSLNLVYLVGLHIYYKMIHGPYNFKLIVLTLQIVSSYRTKLS